MGKVPKPAYDAIWKLVVKAPRIAKLRYCPQCDGAALSVSSLIVRRFAHSPVGGGRMCLACGWQIVQRPIKSKRKRQAVYEADNFECVYCGSTERLSIDHIRPQSMGGDHSFDNLLTSCFSCNTRKGPGRVNLTPRFGRFRRQETV